MKRESGWWLALILIFIVPGLALLSIELFQRHRYAVQRDNINAALVAFNTGAVLFWTTEHGIDVMEGQRPSAGAFSIRTSGKTAWSSAETTWTLETVLNDGTGKQRHSRVVVDLLQEREASTFLETPKMWVTVCGHVSGSVRDRLEHALKDFQYMPGVRAD